MAERQSRVNETSSCGSVNLLVLHQSCQGTINDANVSTVCQEKNVTMPPCMAECCPSHRIGYEKDHVPPFLEDLQQSTE